MRPLLLREEGYCPLILEVAVPVIAVVTTANPGRSEKVFFGLKDRLIDAVKRRGVYAQSLREALSPTGAPEHIPLIDLSQAFSRVIYASWVPAQECLSGGAGQRLPARRARRFCSLSLSRHCSGSRRTSTASGCAPGCRQTQGLRCCVVFWFQAGFNEPEAD